MEQSVLKPYSESPNPTDRRLFLKKILFAAANVVPFLSCNGTTCIPAAPPVVPYPPDDTIAFFGDSLTVGTGGLPYGNFVERAFQGRPVSINGIGGQNSRQIAARQGGVSIQVSVEGDAFSGSKPVNIRYISPDFLSTMSNSKVYTSKGTLVGTPCTITRTVKSGLGHVESYSVTPDTASTVSIPSNSVFMPDDAARLRNATQVLWLGRNNTGKTFAEDVLSDVDACIAFLQDPKKFLVLGVLTAVNETKGTGAYSVINRLNDSLRNKYSSNFVAMTPPEDRELAAVRFVSTADDEFAISNGAFPMGVRSDKLHLNEVGYEIVANRVIAKLKELKL